MVRLPPSSVAVLIAASLLGWVGTHGRAGAAEAETLAFASESYAGFRQIFQQEPPMAQVTVAGTLRFPDTKQDRYPAVVLVHTIAGFQEANEGWHAAEFRRAGFATLTYDSFAARGLGRDAILGAEGGPPIASGVADAFAALRSLAADSRIDPDRIAIVGFSYGGEVAYLTALARLRALLSDGGHRFSAHIAFYPAGVYAAAAAPGAFTGAPILVLLGGRDDNLPVAKIDGYLAYARDNGAPPPIETTIYPDAYHAWTVSSLGRPRFYSQYGSTKACPFILFGPGGISLLIGGQAERFDPALIRACVRAAPGYTMGFDAETRARSAADALAFLRRHLEQ